VVFDHNTVIFISIGKGGGAYKKSLLCKCKTQIVKVDRNKNVANVNCHCQSKTEVEAVIIICQTSIQIATME
jgi:hypothetical protein